MSRRKEIPIETKVDMVRRYLVGKVNQGAAAEEGGIRAASFQQWIKKYEAEDA